MDAEIKKAKIKAKLRNETCSNCFFGKTFVDLRTSKVKVLCKKHKHGKKPHEWCRFYTGYNSDMKNIKGAQNDT